MRIILLLCGLLTAIPLANGGLKPEDINGYWMETGISTDFLRGFFSNAECKRSEFTRLACVNAVRAARSLIGAKTLNLSEEDFDADVQLFKTFHSQLVSKQLLYGKVINAELQVFDAHAFLMPRKAFDAAWGPKSEIRYFAGLNFMATKDGVRAALVMPNSTAERMGIQSFDRILKIGNKPVADLDQASRLLSEAGETQSLNMQIERAGKIKDLKADIRKVGNENLKIEVRADHLAYARLAQFKAGACQELKTKLQQLKPAPAGLILDLRFNPGGFKSEATCMAGLFIGTKPVVAERPIYLPLPGSVLRNVSSLPPLRWDNGPSAAAFPDMPLAILINHLSASSSEIVAGALQDHGRAWIVGERSYGKGSVQDLGVFAADSHFYLARTIALFYRPNGSTNELSGVTPNFIVPFRPGAEDIERGVLREQELRPGALKPLEPTQPWLEPRAKEVETLKACATNLESVDDYQQAFGAAVLRCAGPKT